MMNPQQRIRAILALAACLALAGGCSTLRNVTRGGATWNVPTIFAFRGADDADQQRIEDVFHAAGYGWERRPGPATSYIVRGIPTTNALGRLLQQLEDTLDRSQARAGRDRPEVFLAQAGLNYTSLEANAGFDTNVTINVTPGAAAYIADGDTLQPWRAVPVNADGRWSGRVDTTRAVAAQGGWLYIGARAYDRLTWSRVNVLTGERQVSVASTPFPEPPPDAPVLHRRTPAPRETEATTPAADDSTWLDSLFGR